MILERYLSREIWRHFAAVLGIILVIFVSKRCVELLADAASGKLAVDVLVSMLTLNVIAMLGLLVPISFFLGTFIAVNRMQRDNELIAVANAGLGRGRIALMAMGPGGLTALALLAVTLLVAPWAERRIADIEAAAREQSDLLGIAPGRFKELSGGDRVLYVERLSPDRVAMENVFLQARQDGRTGVLTSRRARLETEAATGARYVVFKDGNRYTGEPGGLEFSLTHYETYGVRIEPEDSARDQWRVRAVPSSEILLSDRPTYRAEWQWRLSLPLSVVLLTLLAVHLVRIERTSTYYAGLLTATLCYFTYNNLLDIARTLVKRDQLTHWIGVWPVHVIVVLLVISLAQHRRLHAWLRAWPVRKR